MAQTKTMKAIKYLQKRLEESGVRITRIVLFGSHAAGTATEDSDIDLVIISPDFRGKDIFKRAVMTGMAERRTIKKFMVPFDIITMTPEEFDSGRSVIADYAQQGITVYAA